MSIFILCLSKDNNELFPNVWEEILLSGTLEVEQRLLCDACQLTHHILAYPEFCSSEIIIKAAQVRF